jgi:ribosomal protein S18 acetylase RimI-like enzyme
MNRSTERPPLITPDFLNAVLPPALGLDPATTIYPRYERLTGQPAFNANVWRIYLTYDPSQSHAPASLIAKLPTVQAELHERATILQPGARENWFYRVAAPRSPVLTPRCYYQAIDETTGQSVLLLEDIVAPTGSQLAGATPAQVRIALASLARLHAAWWLRADSVEIQELMRLLTSKWREEQNLVGELYDAAWPQFLRQAIVPISEEARQFGAAIVGNITAVDALIDRAPKTLVHGDYRLENIHFGEHKGQAACWIIDWEDVFFGSGMVDVAWFLGGCLPVEFGDHEMSLLRHYYQTLLDEGVTNYSWEQCLDDYRCGMCSGFVQGVLSATLDEDADEVERQLASVVAQRFIAATERLQLAQLLKPSIMSAANQSNSIIIRRAIVADAEALPALRLEALQCHPEAFGSDYERESARPASFWVERLSDRADSAIFVAESAGQLVGMIGIYRSELVKLRHNATIWGVYVRPQWRGRGIAVDLLQTAVNWAERQGLKWVKLAVIANNGAAIRAYVKSGFRAYGVDPAVIYHDGVYYDELLMARQL